MKEYALYNITKEYNISNNKIMALDNITFKFVQGEFIAIIGKSGSGKSTLINVIGLLDNPSYGSYFFNGKNVKRYTQKEKASIRNNDIGFIFQSFNLISNLSAFQNVELPLIYKGVGTREREYRVAKALRSVGLVDRMNHKPAELSGGQQQRVAIARAIITDADLILADEPTGNLDTNYSQEIMFLLSTLNKYGKTVVIITHDVEIANQTNRIVEIADGKIIKDVRLM